MNPVGNMDEYEQDAPVGIDVTGSGGEQPIRIRVLRLEFVPANTLRPNPRNWRTHGDEQRSALRGILHGVGFAGVQLVRIDDDGCYELVDGHLRQEEMGTQLIPVAVTDLTMEESDAVLATHDAIGRMAGGDRARFDALLSRVHHMDMIQPALTTIYDAMTSDVGLFPPPPAFIETPTPAATPVESVRVAGNLSEKFMLPPFSVLNAREGWWQDRKRAWLSLGIQSELGRGDVLPGGGGGPETDTCYMRRGSARAFNDHDWMRDKLGKVQARNLNQPATLGTDAGAGSE